MNFEDEWRKARLGLYIRLGDRGPEHPQAMIGDSPVSRPFLLLGLSIYTFHNLFITHIPIACPIFIQFCSLRQKLGEAAILAKKRVH